MRIKSFETFFKFFFPCLILSFLKLWLVGGEEIVVRVSDHDETWFIEAANHLINFDWFGPFNKLTLIRPPAYPFWIGAVHWAGVPLRIGTEILLLVSAFLFTWTLVKARMSPLIGLLVFISIIFHPVSVHINNEAQCESFYASLQLLVLSGMFGMLLSQDLKWLCWTALLTGIALALLWNTRLETLVIVVYMLAYAILVILFLSGTQVSRRQMLRHLSIVLGIPTATLIIFNLAIRGINDAKYGISETCEINGNAFNDAYRSLLRIKHDHPRQYISVPKDVREKAYRASPAFRELQSAIEGKVGKVWVEEWGCPYNHVCDDISGNAFFWSLRDAVADVGHHQTGKESEKFYEKIAQEIDSACREGRLECNRSFSGFLGILHPYPSTYFPKLWVSFLNIVTMFGKSDPYPKEKDSLSTPSEHRTLFDFVANRRPSLAQYDLSLKQSGKGQVFIGGWAYGFADPIVKTMIRNKSGKTLADNEEFYFRKDVVDHFSALGLVMPLHTGFRVYPTFKENELETSSLVFVRKSGREVTVPILKTGKTTSDFYYSIDRIDPPNARWGLQHRIGRIYEIFQIGLTLLAVPGLILVLIFGTIRREPTFYFVLIMVALVIGLRVALCTILDASAFPLNFDDAVRYAYPAMILYPCLLLLILYQGVKLAMIKFTARKSG
ncbi:MAG: hypothetical protein U1F66_05320 [bacterium]